MCVYFVFFFSLFCCCCCVVGFDNDNVLSSRTTAAIERAGKEDCKRLKHSKGQLILAKGWLHYIGGGGGGSGDGINSGGDTYSGGCS